ncbi:MAG: hypothetical protein ABSB70_08150 [Candidatus Velthaea sp.]|jgi:hypothetical protein
MMHDLPSRIAPVLNLTRNQMELDANIHSDFLAIVSGRDETQVLQFDGAAFDRMMSDEILALVREIHALCVIVSSPSHESSGFGAVVTVVDRHIESFFAPIVRIRNADSMVGDFRPADVPYPTLFERIHAELSVNWLENSGD